MPSRNVCWVIVLIWLAATTWFVIRDVVPMFQVPDAPQIVIDLTDEVGQQYIRWDAYQNGQPVGRGRSYVKNAEDRTFELGSEFFFKDLTVLNLPIFEMSSKYNVDKKGRLLRLESVVKTNFAEIKIMGEVKNEKLYPRLFATGAELKWLKIEPVDVSKYAIPNTMHLVRKLRGLREGKTWKVPLLEPLVNGLQTKGMVIPYLEAIVNIDSMIWENKRYVCYRIEYRDPKSAKPEEVRARTWVRKLDGAVLKQEANHHGMQLVLLRTQFVGRRMPLHLPKVNPINEKPVDKQR